MKSKIPKSPVRHPRSAIESPSRRKFIKQSAVALAGAYLGFYAPRLIRTGPNAGPSSDMQFRTMGQSGFRVSEIGFGGYPVRDPNVVRYAIDRGINYIDTAWDYTNGVSESTIGKAIRNQRENVVLTTKWHPWSRTSAEEMMNMLNTSLKRLQTDHVDFLLVHQIGRVSGGESIERLRNAELFKAMNLAKKQGKVRYFGCSGHDPDLMEVMNFALEIPEIALILCRYNFQVYATEPELFKKAKAKGVGVVGMKTLAGARGEDLSKFKGRGTTFRQSALKWVLSNPDVSNLIISISSRRQVDEFVKASTKRPLTAEERQEVQSKVLIA